MRYVDLRLLFPIRPPAFPGARWLLGAALLAGLLGFFWACGIFSRGSAVTQPEASVGAALFFSTIIAYVVPIFGYISERTRLAVEALRSALAVDDAQVDQWRDRVHRKPLRWLVIVLTIGVVSGIAHNALLYRSPVALLQAGFSSSATTAQVLGTLLTWIVVTGVVAGLLDNARMLAQAAQHCRITLLDTSPLRPFASVAVLSTLALIGAQAAFPIMGIEDDLDRAAYIPGLLATGVPMLLIAALPVWPVHRRIATAKRNALADVNAGIAALGPPTSQAPSSLVALAPLLTYRRELLAVSEWPFDVGVVTRLGLYLIIPPLTWIGAALIEHVVDAFL